MLDIPKGYPFEICLDLFGSVSKSVWICFKICLDLFGYLFGSSRISVSVNFWACSLAFLLGASAAAAFGSRACSHTCHHHPMFLYLPPAQGPIGPAAPAAGGGLTWPWRVGPWRGGRGGPGPGGGRAGPGGWTGPGGQGGVGRVGREGQGGWAGRGREGGQGGAGRVGPGMHVLICHTCGWRRT